VNGVIHLAGIPDEADVHDLVETNIVGSYNVLEAARQAGVRRVVLASTGRVIGMYDVREQVDASMQARPDGFYAWTKVAIEALGRLYSDKFNLEVGSVRLGLMAERPMDARALSVWVSPRDAVAAFTTLMTADFNGYVDMFGYSANEHLLVDRTSHEALGFLPADNASDYSIEGVAGPLTSGPQGGFRVTPEYSLKYQHPLE
jgi:uronate dehydrogenase